MNDIMATISASDASDLTSVAHGDIVTMATRSDSDNNAIITDTILKIVYIMIGSSAVIGNGFVVMVIFTSTTMRKSVTNTFIINQSLVDGLAGILLILTTSMEDNGRYLSGLGDDLYCRLWLTNVPLWAAFMSSSFNLMAIAIERFIAVWKPLWHKVSFTRNKVAIFMMFCWVIGPGYTFIYGSLASAIKNGKCLAYGVPGQLSRSLGMILMVLQYLLPVVVFTICYSGIYIILRQKQKQLRSHDGQPSTSTSKASRNVIKTMALVCLCFVLCWTINQVIFCLHQLGHPMDFDSPFYHFSVVAIFLNCCCNPFVYILKYREFRNKLRALMCCKRSVAPESSGNHSGTATNHS